MEQQATPPAPIQGPHQNIQSVVATGGVYKGQGRNQRKLMTCAYWEFLVHGGQLQTPIPVTTAILTGYPILSDQNKLVDAVSVARVRPRTSKGITDLLLLSLIRLEDMNLSKKSAPTLLIISVLFSRVESRSLSELTRQITPPTKNGHAPPTTKSRKSH